MDEQSEAHLQRIAHRDKLQQLVRQKNKGRNSNFVEEEEYVYENEAGNGFKGKPSGPLNSSDRPSSFETTIGHPSTAGRTPLPYNDFGTFFGPSKRVVSERVLEEDRARLEARKIAAREGIQSRENDINLKGQKTRQKHREQEAGPSKGKLGIANANTVQEKPLKVEKLKKARDYSFLDEDGPTKPTVKVENKGAHFNEERRSVPEMHQQEQLQNRSMQRQRTPEFRVQEQAKSTFTQARAMAGRANQSQGSGKYVGKPNGGISGVNQRLAHISGNSTKGLGRGLSAGSSVQGSRRSLTPTLPDSRTKISSRATAMSSNVTLPNKSGFSGKAKPILQRNMNSMDAAQRKQVSRNDGRPTYSGAQNFDQRGGHRYTKDNRNGYRDDDNDSLDSFLEDDDEFQERGGRLDLSSVLGMFRRNHKENHRNDTEFDDDKDMEAGWEDIRREESRSARIARMEDEREKALEEEEERRQLERKKRKLNGK